MNKIFNTKHEQSGRSMVEMLGVLLIMGVITAGAAIMIGVGVSTIKRGNVDNEVMSIVTGVRELYGKYDDFSDIDNNTAFAVFENKSLKNKYEVSVNPGDPQQFVITIKDLSKSDCKYFTTRAWTDSVIYQISDGKQGGAYGEPENCDSENGKNSVSIIYGG